jgi:hypothetical protein
MREFRTSGSVEGAVGNHRPYSDQRRQSPAAEVHGLARSTASAGGYTDPCMTLAAPGGWVQHCVPAALGRARTG